MNKHESPLGYGPEVFSFDYGSHIFILARPLGKDWSHYDGTTWRRGRDEWRPVMITGHGRGQKVVCVGSTYHYDLEDFELGPVLDLKNLVA